MKEKLETEKEAQKKDQRKQKAKEYEKETACHKQYRNDNSHSPFRKKNGTPQRRPV